MRCACHVWGPMLVGRVGESLRYVTAAKLDEYVLRPRSAVRFFDECFIPFLFKTLRGGAVVAVSFV